MDQHAPWTESKKYVVEEFFGYMSTAEEAPPHASGAGLDILGRYCECAANNVVKDAAFKGPEDLQKFPLTFRAGHPYYSSGVRDSQLTAFGLLRGGSWGAHVKSCAVKLDAAALRAEGAVLLVEGDASGAQRPVVCVSGDVRLRGIVVRRGGVLLLADDVPETTLRVNFVLVETGGVLQAGSPDGDGYRYRNRLSVVLTHPAAGYGPMPVVASQCPYHVYAPGVQWIHESEPGPTPRPAFSGFDGTGMCFTNAFAAKAVAVGFNGTCVLCGGAAPLVPYNGTWRSLDGAGATRTNGKLSLSRGEGQTLLDAAYRLCWARLSPGSGAQGAQSLALHADDTEGLSLADVAAVFAAGAQVLVTGSSPEFSNASCPSGLVPLYVAEKDGDDPTGANAAENGAAVAAAAKSFCDGGRGVEVVVVAGVAQEAGLFVLRLRDKLRLDHSLQPVRLARAGETATVEVTHHVALLTRNVKIDGQDLQNASAQLVGGTGCNRYVDPEAPGAMGLGLANQTHAQLMGVLHGGAATAGPAVKACAFAAPPCGSGGGVTFNYAKDVANKALEITSQCYANFEAAGVERLTGAGSRPRDGGGLQGSWLFGTAGAGRAGCNALFGGTCMFRYGSSVLLDAVELVRMGIAPNFGSLGQYALHFHLFGFAKSFRGYLPPGAEAYCRDAAVRNCSIWRSYSRFVTLHGACEVDVCNNVCALGFGSGFFVEDGTELLNVFQHNLVCCVFPCVPNDYFNPQGVMPNVSTDVCQLSLFWLKNNLNAVARNVGCCCPGNTTFVWYVPQLVGQLRGPSAVCMGSERYALPACGSIASIDGPNGIGTATPAVNNHGGALVKFSTGRTCGGAPCACWVPADFRFPFTDPATACSAYTADNTETPLFLHAENVGYCLPLYHSEFPEGISNGPQTMDQDHGGAQGCSWFFQGSRAQPQFLPANGQNACTDSYVGVYAKHQWLLEHFGPQPLDAKQQGDAKASCAQWTLDALQQNMLPKLFSGVLTFNLGASTGLWGGAGWVKAVPPVLVDCCFLETSARIAGSGAASPMGVANNNLSFGAYASQTSTFFGSSTSTDGKTDFPNLYTVLHNFMTNGAVSLSSNVTVVSGAQSFLDTDTATFALGGEYSGAAKATFAVAVFDLDVAKLFGDKIWKTASVYGPPPVNQVQLFEYTTGRYYLAAVPGAGPSLQGSFRAPPPGTWPASPVKYPYLCGQNGLLTTAEASAADFGAFPWLRGKVANAVTAQFQTVAAQAAGDAICQNLARTWQNLPSVDGQGQRATTLAVIGGLPAACSVPAAFLSPS